MKQAFSILAASLALVRAIPQGSNGGLSNLPACGQQCIGSMLSKATSDPLFGCTASNLTECACCNVDFGYGIRDCSRAVCGGENADYSSVISYGLAYCSTAVSSCPSSSAAHASSVLAGATGSATGSASGSGATGIGALIAAGVSPVSGASNEYVLGGSTTISAGGNAATISGAQITALPSGSGIDVSAGSFMTTVPASALGAAGAAGGAAGLAGLAAAVARVSGASNEYVVGGSSTISAGGNAATVSGAVFTALPSNGGVDVSSGSAQTTLDAATVSGAGGAAGGAAGLAGLAALAHKVSGASNEYVIGSSTISAGGNAATVSGAVFTALPSNGGVDVSSGSAMTTLDAGTVAGAGGSSTSGGAAGGAGGVGGSMTSSGGSGGESTASSGSAAASGSSTTSSALAPAMTAAPALIGAAALAILAL